MQMANCSVDVHRKRQLQVISLHGHDEMGSSPYPCRGMELLFGVCLAAGTDVTFKPMVALLSFPSGISGQRPAKRPSIGICAMVLMRNTRALTQVENGTRNRLLLYDTQQVRPQKQRAWPNRDYLI
jgi:hypothetical protein